MSGRSLKWGVLSIATASVTSHSHRGIRGRLVRERGGVSCRGLLWARHLVSVLRLKGT